jgi:large subunit ribosomal protein L13
MKVLDGENRILGRFASHVASEVRNGEEVRVVNSEKVVVSGEKEKVLADYKQKYDRGRRDTGPYFPKRSDKILKRTIRGMLPKEKKSGRKQHSRVKTYLGVPEEFEDQVEDVDVKSGGELKNRNYVKLTEIAKHIGGDQ